MVACLTCACVVVKSRDSVVTVHVPQFKNWGFLIITRWCSTCSSRFGGTVAVLGLFEQPACNSPWLHLAVLGVLASGYPQGGWRDSLSRLGSLLKVGNSISGPFGCLFSLGIPINALYTFVIIILGCVLPVGGFTVHIHCVMIATVVELCLTATVLCYAIGVIIVLLCFTALCHNDSVLH